MAYVEVPSERIFSLLESKGFKRYENYGSFGGTEIVYCFAHQKNPKLMVKVFTSISEGQTQARDCGKDAIRILTVYENKNTGKSFAVWKGARVYRTGTVEGVLERMLERCREAYQAATDKIKEWANQETKRT